MNKPLVSIIMPAYNCENYIKKAINSILNQTYTNFELLIADDCSTDNTKKIIDEYPDARIKTYHNKTNLGYLKASNKLFKESKGEYLSFQDADDYSDTKRIEKLVNFLLNNSEIKVIGSNITKVNENDEQLFTSSFPLTHQEIILKFRQYKTVFTGSALMIRKEVITELYNEYFDRVGSEDIYLYSLLINKFKLANIPDSLYFYRKNTTSVTATHKNPKAFVGHELIMKMYFRRIKAKTDFIYNKKNWKVADVYLAFFVEIRNLKLESKIFSLTLLQLCLKHPIIALDFFKEFKKLFLYKINN